MAIPKKKSGAGGGGQEPPDELAAPTIPNPADFGNQRLDNTITVQGPVTVTGDVGVHGTLNVNPPAGPIPPIPVTAVGPVKVSLQRSTADPTDDQSLWVAIRDKTSVMSFSWYERFIDRVLAQEKNVPPHLKERRDRSQLAYGVDAYQLLKAATETFLLFKCGVLRTPDQFLPTENRFARVRREEEARLGRSLTLAEVRGELTRYIGAGNLPYIDRVLDSLDDPGAVDDDDAPLASVSPMAQIVPALDREDVPSPFDDTVLDAGPFYPLMLELIWSYWHEEGMVVQAINAISLRFQNKRLPGGDNPLSSLELSPLRPLSNLLWGYIQDEPFRLTVARRAYEYSHQYGLALVGRAVPGMRPADHRSKFLEAFHSLLRQVAQFYKEDADTTVVANGFPLLNSLKEVHMLLAEGAHNQFGDLPWTARVEMLIQQWLLSRRELRDFLRGRPMVPYKEPWMGQVDTLRRMFGWGDTPVTHFRDLATFGEQLLLSVRYGDWINVDVEDAAKNWARYWKPEIQGYIHAYRAVTGVDLTLDDQRQVNAVLPSVLLQRRIAGQGSR
ncbi:MAG: hypothetical protein ABUT39_09680 [Acidobacteriota bacterium]